MSAFLQLQQELTKFWQLPYHNNSELANKLQQVQTWQRERIYRTHADLFGQAKYQAMGKFLLDQLYGGEKFNLLAKQLERMATKAEKLEKFVPQSAVTTGVAGVQATLNAIKLDLEIAEYLHAKNLAVNEATMLEAYRALNREHERKAQIAELKQMCLLSDKHLKGFMLQKAFSIAKPMANKSGFNQLYDFIAEGFTAIKPIKNVEQFIEPFCAKENAIIDNVHAGKPNPFAV